MRLVSRKYGNAIAVCVIAIALGQIGAAQESRGDQPKGLPAPPSTLKPPSDAAPRSAPVAPRGPNIQVEITISDQVGSEPPLKKTLNVIAADHGSGAIRSTATVAVPSYPPGPDPKGYSYERLPLNVDIKPEVLKDGLISMQLTLNYETYYSSKASGPAVRSVVFINQWVMLENGKPLVVSQSADATTDRKVTVELKATIMK
jgi:hypothetical protein